MSGTTAEPRKNGPIGSLAIGGAGLTIGTILGAVIQGQPEIVQTVASWGPGVLILAGFGWLARPFIQAHHEMAANVGRLGEAIRENLRRDDDVRDAVRSLAAKMDKHQEIVLQHIQRTQRSETA